MHDRQALYHLDTLKSASFLFYSISQAIINSGWRSYRSTLDKKMAKGHFRGAWGMSNFVVTFFGKFNLTEESSFHDLKHPIF